MNKRINHAHLCKDLFGELPEDVVSPLNSASESLFWLEAIFIAIKKEADGGGNTSRINHLAGAGAYLALEFGNYAGVEYERMMEKLKAAGECNDQ